MNDKGSSIVAGFIIGVMFLVVVGTTLGAGLIYEYKVKKLEERIVGQGQWLLELDEKLEKYQKYLGAV